MLSLHALVPRWSILAIITLSAPLLTLIILLARGGRNAGPPLQDHIRRGLAGTVNELTLFLAAGVLAATGGAAAGGG